MKIINKILIIASYVILLYRTFKVAVKMLIKSHTINENALITISAIGAYFVDKQMEGLMVIILYEIGKILEEKAVNNSRNSINSNINTTRNSINSNINTTRNSISNLMTRRFDTVDDTLTQLSNDLESNKNTIISAVGTKASELETNLTIVAESIQTNLANVAVNIQTNLANLIERKSVTLTNKVDGIQILIDAINTNKIGTNADTTNNTLFGIAKVALSKVNDIQTDLSTLMTNVSNNLSTLSSDVSSIKVDVSSLSSKIGGYSDATTETTLFGRTNLIFEKVSNVGNMVNTLITEQRTANTNITTKLESILAQNDLAQINDAIVDDLTRAYVNNWQTNSGLTDKQKMEFVITWLRDRNYIK